MIRECLLVWFAFDNIKLSAKREKCDIDLVKLTLISIALKIFLIDYTVWKLHFLFTQTPYRLDSGLSSTFICSLTSTKLDNWVITYNDSIKKECALIWNFSFQTSSAMVSLTCLEDHHSEATAFSFASVYSNGQNRKGNVNKRQTLLPHTD